jgi:hypothetical protein
MAKILIDYKPETDNTVPHLVFKQEGKKGLVLPLYVLAEFLDALEISSDFEVFYYWQNYGVRKTVKSATIVLSTQETPLLHLDAEQIPKLVSSLRTRFPDYL